MRLPTGRLVSGRRLLPGGLLVLGTLLASCWGGGEIPESPRDPELARLAARAFDAFEIGDLERASVLFTDALDRARAADDSEAIFDHAWNLATCRRRLGDLDGAERLLDEAEMELGILSSRDVSQGFERSGSLTSSLALLRAELAGDRGELAAGRHHATAILGASYPAPAARAHAQLLLAEWALTERSFEEASDALLAARASGPLPSALEARALGVEWKLAVELDRPGEHRERRGDPAEIVEEQLVLLRDLGDHVAVRRVLLMVAERAETEGMAFPRGSASAYYYRAARSALAASDATHALEWAERGLRAFERAPGLLSIDPLTRVRDAARRELESREPEPR